MPREKWPIIKNTDKCNNKLICSLHSSVISDRPLFIINPNYLNLIPVIYYRIL